MSPVEIKLARLQKWVEEAGLKANIARIKICAAQHPEIPELNRAIELIGLAEMELESISYDYETN
jgi:hypothetical protein